MANTSCATKGVKAVTKYVWSVATGAVNPFLKKSREAVKFLSQREGFVAVHPNGNGTLWLYDSQNAAKSARNTAEAKGIKCGRNICRFRWEGDTLIFDDPDYKEGQK